MPLLLGVWQMLEVVLDSEIRGRFPTARLLPRVEWTWTIRETRRGVVILDCKLDVSSGAEVLRLS